MALHVSSDEMIEFLTILEDGIRTIQVEDEQGTSNVHSLLHQYSVKTFSKLLFMPLTCFQLGVEMPLLMQ